jgi:hypothetical protein
MNKRDAIKELIIAKKQSLSTFSESFIIYRYRQIIEDKLYEQDPILSKMAEAPLVALTKMI